MDRESFCFSSLNGARTLAQVSLREQQLFTQHHRPWLQWQVHCKRSAFACTGELPMHSFRWHCSSSCSPRVSQWRRRFQGFCHRQRDRPLSFRSILFPLVQDRCGHRYVWYEAGPRRPRILVAMAGSPCQALLKQTGPLSRSSRQVCSQQCAVRSPTTASLPLVTAQSCCAHNNMRNEACNDSVVDTLRIHTSTWRASWVTHTSFMFLSLFASTLLSAMVPLGGLSRVALWTSPQGSNASAAPAYGMVCSHSSMVVSGQGPAMHAENFHGQ